MVQHGNESKKKVSDVSKALGVTPKTIYKYIDDGILPEPQKKAHGLREIYVFTDSYIENALATLETARKKRSQIKESNVGE